MRAPRIVIWLFIKEVVRCTFSVVRDRRSGPNLYFRLDRGGMEVALREESLPVLRPMKHTKNKDAFRSDAVDNEPVPEGERKREAS